jgi:hypothetical protein
MRNIAFGGDRSCRLAALPASATPITTTVNFSLGGFFDINRPVSVPPTVSAATGSLTVTFDPTLNYDDDTTDLTVHSFAGPTVDSALGLTYHPVAHQHFFGGVQNDADSILTGTLPVSQTPSDGGYARLSGEPVIWGMSDQHWGVKS